jgi:hypothetical protein
MTSQPAPFARAKCAVLRALRLRGIAVVEIEYDGEGDDGQIGAISAYDAQDQPVECTKPIRLALRSGAEFVRYASLREALDDFAWTILEHYHGGFQNDGGGFGTFIIDVREGTVKMEHHDRFTSVYSTETEV